MDLQEFHRLVGEVLMYCQIIEHDIKVLYAFMKGRHVPTTLAEIQKKRWTLGHSVQELKRLDYSDGHRYISADDYDYLRQMARTRDYWCHTAYTEFAFDAHYEASESYAHVCRRLAEDHDKLFRVFQTVEQVKLQAARDFGVVG